MEQVTPLAKEHGAEELVLGHPVNMDGTLGPRSEKAKAMKVLLEEATALPVVLWDERRTTIDAHQHPLQRSGKNAKQRKKRSGRCGGVSDLWRGISPIKQTARLRRHIHGI